MSDYQPKPREKFHLTVEAALDESGNLYEFAYGSGAKRAWLSVGSDAVVRVEPLPKPALPTAFGARITTVVVEGAPPLELVLANPDGATRWMSQGGDWFEDDELFGVQVLHDPHATTSTGEAAAPIPEPEPLELPTRFAAVVQATYDGETVVATLADPGSLDPWIVRRNESVLRWVRADELTAIAVLSPGVEVDLP